MGLTPQANHRANILTGISIILCITIFVLTLWLNVHWTVCLWMVLGGLVTFCGFQLVGFVVMKAALARRIWAVTIIGIGVVLMPCSLAVYVAGLLALITRGVIAVFSAVFLNSR